MTSTVPGITALSASQAEEFDPEQVGGCPRRWRLHKIDRLPVPESGAAQEDGDSGHAHFAHYFRTGQRPRRAKMAKAVNGALDAGHLPAREPGQLIESRFDGQPARDANGERLPLRPSSTLWLGGVPWDGYVDLRFYRPDPWTPLTPSSGRAGGTITVLDHKFSSDTHTYAKSDLLATVQMPVYALDSLRIWPDAQHVELIHHYVSRRGVDSFIRRQLVTVEEVRRRGEQIAGLVQKMQEAAAALSAEDVPGNRASCHTWSGCPFQSRCSVFKEKPKMNLDPDELEWLKVLDSGEAAGKAPVSGPEADSATEQEIASAVGALNPADLHGLTPAQAAIDPGDDDPFAIFETPKASTPQEQPASPVAETPKHAVHGVVTGIPSVEKCPDCPHPAHPGAACTGKRGRGACRCGIGRTVDGLVTETTAGEIFAGMAGPRSSHLPTCVQNDAGKWLCMEGCTVALGGGAGVKLTTENLGKPPHVLTGLKVPETARVSGAAPNPPSNFQRDQPRLAGETAEEHADDDLYSHLPPGVAELARVQDEQGRSRGWTGTLRVEVNLGAETLALLQRLLGVKS